MLSICVTIKNRSCVMAGGRALRLFPNCVQSIVDSTREVADAELVVADWKSDDWPLAEWLPGAVGALPMRIVTVTGNFSRGRGRNIAAAAAGGDMLLFLDADSILCATVIAAGMKHLRDGKSYFPILYSFSDAAHTIGWWRRLGFGNCMVTRKTFELAGGWPEYAAWGNEDDDFHARVSAVTEIVREEVPGFCHQWHPNDVDWKDKYAEKRAPTDAELQSLAETEARKFELAKRELGQAIPPGTKFILADEDQWRSQLAIRASAIPFTEKDGEYWGPPETDEAAVAELERLRRAGADFLVFGWPAFWWLNYYLGLERHLRTNYRTILKNDRLVVFDLRT